MAKNNNIRLEGERDMKLLFFLWKWKVATTTALAIRFFPEVAMSTAYRRLWRLEQGGFIMSRADKAGRKFVWLLDKRGYESIRGLLPYELKEDGYKSEHVGHDLVASAFHLGDYFLHLPPGVRMFSEQQIRRFSLEDYPEYISEYQTHVPDGYTYFEKGEKKYTVAFETELNPKAKSNYQGLFPCVDGKGPDFIFWLTPRLTIARRISCYVGEDRHYGNKPCHNFVTYPHFLKQGWGAEIVCGQNQGLPMRRVIEQLNQNSHSTTSQLVLPAHLLNVSKSPHKSKSYKIFEIGDFAN